MLGGFGDELETGWLASFTWPDTGFKKAVLDVQF
jgi:hypothetical protein